MPYQSGLLSDFWTRYNQRRATTGRGLTSQEITGLLEPMLAYDAQKAIAAGERERFQSNFDRQMSLQEQAQRDAASAAKASGITQLAGLGAQGYLGYKGLQLAGQQAAATTGLNSQLIGLLGGGGTPAGAANVGAASLAPTTGLGTLGAGNAGAPYLLQGPTTFGATELAGAGTTAGGAGAGAGAGLGGGALVPGLLGGAAGLGASKLLGANEDISQGLTLGGAGIGIGLAVGGPVGAVIGGVIGGAVSLIDDISVICSELLRQGRITARERKLCILFRIKNIPNDMFEAYLLWAKPIVSIMQKEWLGNFFLLPFTKRFVSYMVKKEQGKNTTLLENIAWRYAWSRCTKIADGFTRDREVT